jgi:hypothetical protein
VEPHRDAAVSSPIGDLDAADVTARVRASLLDGDADAPAVFAALAAAVAARAGR